jgi:hypothetical protein
MHTRASQIYRQTRIPGHTAQFAALVRVMTYLLSRYGDTPEHRQRALRHRQTVIRAITRMR